MRIDGQNLERRPRDPELAVDLFAIRQADKAGTRRPTKDLKGFVRVVSGMPPTRSAPPSPLILNIC